MVWEASCCGLGFIDPGQGVGSGTDKLGLRGARGSWDDNTCKIRIQVDGKESEKSNRKETNEKGNN